MKILFIFLLALGLSSQEFVQHKINAIKNSYFTRSDEGIDEKICDEQFMEFYQAYLAREMWALTFYDTWAKMPSGMPSWNVVNFGDYEKCINFELATSNSSETNFKGQHCFIRLSTNFNSILGFTNAFCMPSSCSSKRILSYINEYFLPNTAYNATFAQCTVPEKSTSLESVDIALISIITSALLLMTFSTLYDLHKRFQSTSTEPNGLLIAFSVYTNGQRLFDTQPSKNTIECLHGMRALSILWIMFGHRVSNQLNFPIMNPSAVISFYQQPYSVILSSYSIAVDTFLLMAALLLTSSTLRAIDKRTLNIPRMIFHRYIRYTPVLAVAILCTISLPKYLLSGPLEVGEFQENCRNYWWSAILHVHNYVNPDKLCLNHTWYLAVDFQLFLISPFIILLINRYRKLIWCIPIPIILCSIYIFLISYLLNVRKMPITDQEGEIYHRYLYHPTHARIQSWFIGIALGFLFHSQKSTKMKISSILKITLWILAISTIIFIVLITYVFATPYISHDSSILTNAIFMSIHRIAWALAVAYIIFACDNLKSGSIIRVFLSSPLWKPIGTMGLSLYITHLIYMMFMMMNLRQAFDFTLWKMFAVYCGDLLPCFFIAIFFYLAFEAPIMIVENILYKKLIKSE